MAGSAAGVAQAEHTAIKIGRTGIRVGRGELDRADAARDRQPARGVPPVIAPAIWASTAAVTAVDNDCLSARRTCRGSRDFEKRPSLRRSRSRRSVAGRWKQSCCRPRSARPVAPPMFTLCVPLPALKPPAPCHCTCALPVPRGRLKLLALSSTTPLCDKARLPRPPLVPMPPGNAEELLKRSTAAVHGGRAGIAVAGGEFQRAAAGMPVTVRPPLVKAPLRLGIDRGIAGIDLHGADRAAQVDGVLENDGRIIHVRAEDQRAARGHEAAAAPRLLGRSAAEIDGVRPARTR